MLDGRIWLFSGETCLGLKPWYCRLFSTLCEEWPVVFVLINDHVRIYGPKRQDMRCPRFNHLFCNQVTTKCILIQNTEYISHSFQYSYAGGLRTICPPHRLSHDEWCVEDWLIMVSLEFPSWTATNEYSHNLSDHICSVSDHRWLQPFHCRTLHHRQQKDTMFRKLKQPAHQKCFSIHWRLQGTKMRKSLLNPVWTVFVLVYESSRQTRLNTFWSTNSPDSWRKERNHFSFYGGSQSRYVASIV